MTRTRRSSAVAALLGVGAAALLAGCGAQAAGAASIVGDQRVSQEQVSSDVAEIRAELGTRSYDPATITAAVVTRLTQALIIDTAAQREGITVTQAQVDKLIADNAKAAGGVDKLDDTLLTQFSVPNSAVPGYALLFLQQRALGKKLAPTAGDGGAAAAATYLDKLSTELDTQVAPRYGTWDPSKFGLGPAPTDISSPAP